MHLRTVQCFDKFILTWVYIFFYVSISDSQIGGSTRRQSGTAYIQKTLTDNETEILMNNINHNDKLTNHAGGSEPEENYGVNEGAVWNRNVFCVWLAGGYAENGIIAVREWSLSSATLDHYTGSFFFPDEGQSYGSHSVSPSFDWMCHCPAAIKTWQNRFRWEMKDGASAVEAIDPFLPLL